MKNAFSTFVFGSYERFIPYYILGIKENYPEADIVIFYAGVLSCDIKEFIDCYNDDSIILLENFYTKYFELVENYKIKGGGSKTLLRFLIPGCYFKKYSNVYFGDVDILILKEKQDLFNFHLFQADSNNIPFSNKVRQLPNSKKISNRLTGLHFVKTNEYFLKIDPIIDRFLSSENYRNKLLRDVKRDEEFLYKINLEAFGFDPVKLSVNKRPWHGFHIGLVRGKSYLDLETIKENSSISIDNLKQQLLDLNSRGTINQMLYKYTCKEIYFTYKYLNLPLSLRVRIKYDFLDKKNHFLIKLKKIKNRISYD